MRMVTKLMSFQITNTEDYFLLEFKGCTSLEENELARKELITGLNKNTVDAVLVDMTKADLSDINLDDLIKFGESWEGELYSNSTKFATLVPNDNPFRNKIDLSLWVGMSKGVQLKIFEKKSLAIQWLKMKD